MLLISWSNLVPSMMTLHNWLGIRGASWHRFAVVRYESQATRGAAGVNPQTDGSGVATLSGACSSTVDHAGWG